MFPVELSIWLSNRIQASATCLLDPYINVLLVIPYTCALYPFANRIVVIPYASERNQYREITTTLVVLIFDSPSWHSECGPIAKKIYHILNVF